MVGAITTGDSDLEYEVSPVQRAFYESFILRHRWSASRLYALNMAASHDFRQEVRHLNYERKLKLKKMDEDMKKTVQRMIALSGLGGTTNSLYDEKRKPKKLFAGRSSLSPYSAFSDGVHSPDEAKQTQQEKDTKSLPKLGAKKSMLKSSNPVGEMMQIAENAVLDQENKKDLPKTGITNEVDNEDGGSERVEVGIGINSLRHKNEHEPSTELDQRMQKMSLKKNQANDRPIENAESTGTLVAHKEELETIYLPELNSKNVNRQKMRAEMKNGENTYAKGRESLGEDITDGKIFNFNQIEININCPRDESSREEIINQSKQSINNHGNISNRYNETTQWDGKVSETVEDLGIGDKTNRRRTTTTDNLDAEDDEEDSEDAASSKSDREELVDTFPNYCDDFYDDVFLPVDSVAGDGKLFSPPNNSNSTLSERINGRGSVSVRKQQTMRNGRPPKTTNAVITSVDEARDPNSKLLQRINGRGSISIRKEQMVKKQAMPIASALVTSEEEMHSLFSLEEEENKGVVESRNNSLSKGMKRESVSTRKLQKQTINGTDIMVYKTDREILKFADVQKQLTKEEYKLSRKGRNSISVRKHQLEKKKSMIQETSEKEEEGYEEKRAGKKVSINLTNVALRRASIAGREEAVDELHPISYCRQPVNQVRKSSVAHPSGRISVSFPDQRRGSKKSSVAHPSGRISVTFPDQRRGSKKSSVVHSSGRISLDQRTKSKKSSVIHPSGRISEVAESRENSKRSSHARPSGGRVSLQQNVNQRPNSKLSSVVHPSGRISQGNMRSRSKTFASNTPNHHSSEDGRKTSTPYNHSMSNRKISTPYSHLTSSQRKISSPYHMKKYDDFLTESDFHATKAKYLSRPMNAIAEPFAM